MTAELTVGFLPWWPQNPYQVLLKRELNARGLRVIGNPPLHLLRILLRRDGLDVVHVHWPHGLYLGKLWRYPFALLVLLLYRVLKDNLVWTVHELDFYETRSQWPDRVIRALLMRWCRVLIVHSAESEQTVRRRFLPRGEIVRVRMPSYAGHYPDTVSRGQARERLGLAATARVFLCFGYVKPYKGIDDLIRAFRVLDDADAVLLVVGTPLNPAIADELAALAGGDARIRLDLRYVGDDEIQVFFRAADIAVFPFRHTHSSSSIMLAMTFGCPLIAPAIASIPEYVDTSMAELFDPEQPASLGEALQRAGARDLHAMGEAALRHAKNFRWTDMADSHARAYRTVAGAAGSAAACADPPAQKGDPWIR